LCPLFKIQIHTIEEIYQEAGEDNILMGNYYKWCNEVFKCEQGIEVEDIAELEVLFVKLFDSRKEN
jgi:hypothetical protein